MKNRMWEASVALAIAAVTGSLIAVVITAKQIPALTGLWIIVTVISFINLLLLLFLKAKVQLSRFSTLSFIFQTMVVTLGVVLSQEKLIMSERPFELFAGIKILAFSIGLIAPPKNWVAWTPLTLIGLITFLQFYSWPSDLQSRIALQEPGLTFACVVIAGIIFFFRKKWIEVDQKVAKEQARVIMLQRFANLLINIQHLSNTPFQTIENNIILIQNKYPEAEPLVQSMQRSLERIRKVMKVFSYCDSHVQWTNIQLPEDLEEFEAQLKNLIDMKIV